MSMKIILIFLCSIFLMSCGHHTSPKQYTLQFDCTCIPCGIPTDHTLLILPTRAAGDLQGDSMWYSRQRNQLDAFADHQWTANPAKLMTNMIFDAVHQSHHFRVVALAPTPAIAQYRLSTRLVRLYQDFTRCPSHIVLQLDATISNARNGKLIATKIFKIEVVAPLNTPYGGVIAANKASKILMQQLIIFLQQHI